MSHGSDKHTARDLPRISGMPRSQQSWKCVGLTLLFVGSGHHHPAAAIAAVLEVCSRWIWTLRQTAPHTSKTIIGILMVLIVAIGVRR